MTHTDFYRHYNATDTLYALPVTEGVWTAANKIVGDDTAQPKLHVFAGLDPKDYEVFIQAGDEPVEGDQYVCTLQYIPNDTAAMTGPHHVQITIVDDVTDARVALAEVRMKRPGESGRDTTDVDGLAEFACEADAWAVLVRASGYEGAVRTIQVEGDTVEEIRLTPIVVDVNEDPELCSFRIRFLRVDGSPIVGAAVRAVLARERQCFNGGVVTRLDVVGQDPVTDADGVVTLLLVQGMQVYFTLDGVAESVRSIVAVPLELNAVMTCQR